jgi:hypothetical protein
MDLDEVVARESIRDLVARYNSTLDAGRLDEAMALFAPDAVFTLATAEGPLELSGADAVRDFFSGASRTISTRARSGSRPAYLRHHTATLQIDLTSPTTATGRCYFLVVMPHGVDHWGRYIDRYVLRDGRWLFAARQVRRDGYAPDGFVAAQVARGEAAG